VFFQGSFTTPSRLDCYCEFLKFLVATLAAWIRGTQMNRLFFTMALLLPAAATAQPAAPTPTSFGIDAGEKIIVTRASTRDIIRGRVVLVGYEGLVLDDGPTRLVVPLDDVQRIERRKDRFWNGALIGYGVGFATGATMVLATPCKPDPNAFIDLCFDRPTFAAAFGGLITGPVGFAIGGITDAIKRKSHVVFDRAASDRVAIAVAPALVRRGGGLRVTVGF
jgi:hypothetical protein